MSIASTKKIMLTALSTVIAVSSVQAQTKQLPTLHEHAHHQAIANDSHSNFSVALSKSAIAKTGALSTTDLIKKQGVAFIAQGSGNPNQTMVSMDGFGYNASSNSVLMIDGIPISSFSNIGPNLNNVIVDNIEKLSIQPGSHSVLDGNQAVSGVVNIQTRTPSKPIVQGNIGFGNMYQVVGGFYASDRPNAHWGFNVGLQSLYNQHTHKNSTQQNATFNMNVHHYGSNNLSSVNVISYDNHAQVPVMSIWNYAKHLKGDPTNFDMSGNIIYGTNKHVFNHQLLMDTKLALYNTQLKSSMMDTTIQQNGVYFTNRLQQKHWLVGVDNRYNNYHSQTMAGLNTAEGNIVSGFGQMHFPLVHRLTTQLGARYAYQTLHANGVVTNRLHESNHAWANDENLTYHFNPQWNVRVAHDMSYAFATGKDEIWRLPGTTFAPLKTQTGHHYSFDVNWQHAANKAKLSLYQIDLHNEMAMKFENGMSEMVNLPPTRRRGISLLEQWQLVPQLSLDSQVSFVDPKISSGVDKGKMIPAVSNWNGSIGLTYQNHHQWLAQVEESVHSNFYAAFDLQNQYTKLPGYALTNIHLQKRTKNITYDLSVNNVFNHKYVQFADITTKGKIGYYPADGISVLLHLSFNLMPDSAAN